jgi:hypothetical protein
MVGKTNEALNMDAASEYMQKQYNLSPFEAGMLIGPGEQI